MHLVLPLNYIFLQRPKNTGDVPRSAHLDVRFREREREARRRRQGHPGGRVGNRQSKVEEGGDSGEQRGHK